MAAGLVVWSVSGGPYASQNLGYEYHVPFINEASRGGMEALALTPFFQERIEANPANRDRLLKTPPEAFVASLHNWNETFFHRADTPVIAATRDQLRTIRCPTLVFEGNDDLHSPEAAIRAARPGRGLTACPVALEHCRVDGSLHGSGARKRDGPLSPPGLDSPRLLGPGRARPDGRFAAPNRKGSPMTSSPSTFDPVPPSLESVLDPSWLEQALEDVEAGDRIVEATTVDSLRTVASKIRIRVVVEQSDGSRQVRSYCVKGHFDGSSMSSLGPETLFYRHLQPRVGVRTPRPYYTGVDESTGQSLIIMDDVLADGGQVLTAHSPYSLETIRDTLGQLARLHAATWGSERLVDLGWLGRGVRDTWREFPTDVLTDLLRDGRGPDLRRSFSTAATGEGGHAPDRRHRRDLRGARRSRSRKYLSRPAGRACWLDWQVVHVGHSATDVGCRRSPPPSTSRIAHLRR